MKKLNSSLLNMTLVLVVVCVGMGGLLAWVNHQTTAPIAAQVEKTLNDGIQQVMGVEGVTVTATDSILQDVDGKQRLFVVYHTSDASSQPCGAAVSSTTQGFGGDLTVLTGFDNNGQITGYTILETNETPGLGAKADTWFQKGQKGSIIGLTPDPPLDVKPEKGGKGKVDAITASTITTRAFLKAVNQAYQTLQPHNLTTSQP